jgi:hypothetical protein
VYKARIRPVNEEEKINAKSDPRPFGKAGCVAADSAKRIGERNHPNLCSERRSKECGVQDSSGEESRLNRKTTLCWHCCAADHTNGAKIQAHGLIGMTATEDKSFNDSQSGVPDRKKGSNRHGCYSEEQSPRSARAAGSPAFLLANLTVPDLLLGGYNSWNLDPTSLFDGKSGAGA